MAAVKAYNAAYLVAEQDPRSAAWQTRRDRRNDVLAAWHAAAARTQVAVIAHFAGTDVRDRWESFEYAVDTEVNLSYALDVRARQDRARRLRAYVESTGVSSPAWPVKGRDPWPVIGCTEAGCADTKEWRIYYRWLASWMNGARDALVDKIFDTKVRHPS